MYIASSPVPGQTFEVQPTIAIISTLQQQAAPVGDNQHKNLIKICFLQATHHQVASGYRPPFHGVTKSEVVYLCKL